MSVVLPMPAGPLSHSTRGLPARACSSSAFIATSSCARPTKISLDTSPVWPGERPSGSHAPGDLSPCCYSASPSGCPACIAGLDRDGKPVDIEHRFDYAGAVSGSPVVAAHRLVVEAVDALTEAAGPAAAADEALSV
jgi:hypothetical protein